VGKRRERVSRRQTLVCGGRDRGANALSWVLLFWNLSLVQEREKHQGLSLAQGLGSGSCCWLISPPFFFQTCLLWLFSYSAALCKKITRNRVTNLTLHNQLHYLSRENAIVDGLRYSANKKAPHIVHFYQLFPRFH